jgi:peroxiredoxin
LGLLVLASPAWAQEGRPGREGRMPRMQQLSPEKVKAAWTWEAQGVARELQLGADETAKLVEAYVAGRQKLDERLTALRAERGDGERRRRWRADPEVIEKYRAVLQSQLSGFLSDKQLEEAARSLGVYSPQWDRMVDAVAGLDLEEDQTYAALVPIRLYVVQLAGARELGDRQAMRGLMMEAREGLYDDLEKVLSEQQMAQFQDARGRRGDRERQRRGEGGASEQVDAAGIGEPAPTFTLTDSTGRSHVLADYRGKIVVLQWINPDCPVCRRTSSSGKVTAMRRRLDETHDGVVHLTVNSTHYMEPSVGAAYLKEYKIDAPVLIDRDGRVGRLYGAKRTPHMFVIDAEGVLRYQGAIDDDDRGDKGDGATNYVVQAVRQIVADETVAPDVTRSYGCTVKYAPQ